MSSPAPASPNDQGPRPTPSIAVNDRKPENTIKILLATDNHIGYLEKDPVRGQDSFLAFREILQLAKDHDVDFVLLAGDLFHDNNPSRYAIHQTMGMLREFSLGDKPVQVELLSDPDEGRPEGFTFPSVNYEDYNLNVGTPVFSIHGNHDDPQGTSAAGALSAVDLLSVAGLVNYFGKTDLPADDERSENQQKKGLNISPVLLKKGTTKLALYGIGNVKDSRLNSEMRNGRVRLLKPAEGGDEWFNCILVHQNRVAHSKNEFVPEDVFDDSTDLVIWGHEHDCRIVPEAVAEKPYWISQPGSSVATSLAEGEALEKKVAILRIQGKGFDIEPLPLKTVRPFVMRQIEMADAAEENGVDLTNKQKVTEYLRSQVMECVAEANAQWDERNTGGSQSASQPARPKPLIRLRVETTGVTELTNIPRFGERLDKLVANPGNLLQFYRRRVVTKKNNVSMDQPGGDNSDDDGQAAGTRGTKIKMADLVHEYLVAQELNVLPANALEEAVESFVEKGSKLAIKDFVSDTLKTFVENARRKNLTEEDIEEALQQERNNAVSQFQLDHEEGSSKKKKTKKRIIGDSDEDEMDVDEEPSRARDSFEDDDDDEDNFAPAKKSTKAAPAKKAPATKAPAKKTAAASKGKAKAKGKLFDDGSDEDDSDQSMANRNDDDDDESDEVPVVKKKATKASTSKAPAKKAPVKKAAPKKSTQSQLNFDPVPRRKQPTVVLSDSD
ncbi:Metallo-dependent phosphatase-like protein [Mrakia frigida]|uniref:MRX complex nuclease subunit n=1 Tax=Mrakia frigida TaxID=29902 RepID=UPI003FCC0565